MRAEYLVRLILMLGRVVEQRDRFHPLGRPGPEREPDARNLDAKRDPEELKKSMWKVLLMPRAVRR